MGAAQGVINTTTVKNWLIPNLPLAQQQEFSAKLKMVARLKERQGIQLDESNYLFGSLSQRAFQGEL